MQGLQYWIINHANSFSYRTSWEGLYEARVSSVYGRVSPPTMPELDHTLSSHSSSLSRWTDSTANSYSRKLARFGAACRRFANAACCQRERECVMIMVQQPCMLDCCTWFDRQITILSPIGRVMAPVSTQQWVHISAVNFKWKLLNRNLSLWLTEFRRCDQTHKENVLMIKPGRRYVETTG